jgi:16S rRNA processing protein RimM
VLVEDREGSEHAVFEIETSRHYRDRLILKLEAVDGPDAAERLRGKRILAPAGQVPELEEGTYYLARLVGLEVLDEEGSTVGEIEDILEAGGSEVLVIREEDGSELLVPLARDYVGEVDPATGTMVLRGVEGLRGLNREEGEDRR